MLDQNGLQIDYAKVQKILTTATFDEANQSVFDMKENFFLGDQAMQQINMNKQMQVVKSISQYYLFFPLMYKDFYFVELLYSELDIEFGQKMEKLVTSQCKIVVFFNQCKKCHYWYKVLRFMGLRVSVVHSYLKQFKRNANLLRFISGETQILLATDLASRGLDLKHVQLVVNYDLPANPKGKEEVTVRLCASSWANGERRATRKGYKFSESGGVT